MLSLQLYQFWCNFQKQKKKTNLETRVTFFIFCVSLVGFPVCSMWFLCSSGALHKFLLQHHLRRCWSLSQSAWNHCRVYCGQKGVCTGSPYRPASAKVAVKCICCCRTVYFWPGEWGGLIESVWNGHFPIMARTPLPNGTTYPTQNPPSSPFKTALPADWRASPLPLHCTHAWIRAGSPPWTDNRAFESGVNLWAQVHIAHWNWKPKNRNNMSTCTCTLATAPPIVLTDVGWRCMNATQSDVFR